VTFTFFTSGNCSTGGTVLTPDSTLNGSGVATSASEGPLAAGSYSFQATYNGEAGVYPSSTGACEPLTVNKLPSNTVTAIQQGGVTVTSIASGTSVTDQATVTGSAGTPTGTVTFTFFTSGNCSTGGTVLTPDSTLNGSGVATSASEGPLAAGSYSFSATYNGDGTYSGSTGSCEPLTVQAAGQGCTPGFWKQSQHFHDWVGYTPSELVKTVFSAAGVAPYTSLGNSTLLQALSGGGGSSLTQAAQILLRAATSAVLNAAQLSYPLSTSDIVSQVNAALASNNRGTILTLASTLDGFNNLNCTLS
jgi:hypothetical protein